MSACGSHKISKPLNESPDPEDVLSMVLIMLPIVRWSLSLIPKTFVYFTAISIGSVDSRVSVEMFVYFSLY